MQLAPAQTIMFQCSGCEMCSPQSILKIYLVHNTKPYQQAGQSIPLYDSFLLQSPPMPKFDEIFDNKINIISDIVIKPRNEVKT